MGSISSPASSTRAALLAAVLVYVALVVPIVARQGVNWDEQTDLDIARTYASSLEGLVHGSRIDTINVRLPMYTVAAVYRLTGTSDLRLARWFSVLLGALTLLFMNLYVAATAGRPAALLTCVLLATSPFYLFFSSTAFTEGDIWITCAVAFLLLATTRMVRQRTVAAASLTGLVLGLALSSKISALCLVPPVLLAAYHPAVFGGATIGEAAPGREQRGPRWVLPALATLFLLWLVYAAGLARILPFDVAGHLPVVLRAKIVRFASVAALWAGVGAWCFANRAHLPVAWRRTLVVGLLGAMTFFVCPPVHATNPRILGSLWRELFVAGDGLRWDFLGELAAFHGLVILIKPTLVIGVGMLASLALAAIGSRSRPELRLPLLLTLCYGGFVLLLPWAQTRYLLPVFPVLAFFLADAFLRLFRRSRPMALAAAMTALAGLAYDYSLCYPDLNLNGYQWTGARYLFGRSTIGYRGLVHTPSDGLQQALRWTCDRAGPKDTVLTFFGEEHIFRAECADPVFRRINGMVEPFDLSSADYVLTTINTDLRPGHGTDNPSGPVFQYPHYDRAALERDFTRAWMMRRAFGIETAAVWRRRTPGPSRPGKEAPQEPARGEDDR